MSEDGAGYGTSLSTFVLRAISLGAGGYHGFCDAQGIPIDKEGAEFALKYGPTFLRGGEGAIKGGLVGLISFSSAAAMGTTGGVIVGGIWGSATGAVQTLIGYGLGYVVGRIAS
ncbi:hypothetical protein HOG16_00400 [Candidatus Woesearchaeota archaeon]|jgi:hypothetical protein|nr:hypothetical protein [Candidatus Woesearchaeota archaeon]MBT4322223.1 hypothetical protein [Candidatus Woesearchaeota archaeon]MBT4631243.1 hypothetical protein [Candidatus Woesearchaeota archaeon]